jgi:AbrB family looped-hinge helix DNA binding protein
MTYQTTVTTKGQITIPKAFRDRLRLSRMSRLTVEMDAKSQKITLKPTPDFFEVIKKIKRPKNPMDAVKAREFMEKNYERA